MFVYYYDLAPLTPGASTGPTQLQTQRHDRPAASTDLTNLQTCSLFRHETSTDLKTYRSEVYTYLGAYSSEIFTDLTLGSRGEDNTQRDAQNTQKKQLYSMSVKKAQFDIVRKLIRIRKTHLDHP